MKMLKLNFLEEAIQINPGEIININIENPVLYRKTLLAIYQKNSEIIIYSEDYKVKDEYKNGLFIFDITQININDKKVLNTIYSSIIGTLSEDIKLEVEDVNSRILTILDKLSFNFDLPIEFNHEIDFSKILSNYSFMFEVEDVADTVKMLIAHIKIHFELTNFKYIIGFDLLKLLNETEFELFKKEIEYLQIVFVNITTKNSIIESIRNIVFDGDLCII